MTRHLDSSPENSRTVAYITAGAAGMFCGSCMHDNTLARALANAGVQVQLLPVYTPIRTDEDSVAIDQVFFGGINVYLQQKIPLFRHLPRIFDRMLDQPWLIRRATAKASSTSPKLLGGLTVSMLKGESGYQRKEVHRLCDWLAKSVQPDIVCLSNILIAGCAPTIKKELKVPVLATLQGDDIFLDELPEPYREQAITEIQRLVKEIDGFIVYSQYYADLMSEYFEIPAEKIHLTPLCIDVADFVSSDGTRAATAESRPPTIGYLARLAPEKGLHLLVDAFMKLRQKEGMENTRLRIAGWLGEHRREYAQELFTRLDKAGLQDAYEYVGAIDRQEKVDFLGSVDVLSAPTVYRDPKGLFVLEALAAGVPVVQPRHGAFPELIEMTGGGRLFEPGNAVALADTLADLLTSPAARESLAKRGHANVHANHNAKKMAENMLAIYDKHW